MTFAVAFFIENRECIFRWFFSYIFTGDTLFANISLSREKNNLNIFGLLSQEEMKSQEGILEEGGSAQARHTRTAHAKRTKQVGGRTALSC